MRMMSSMKYFIDTEFIEDGQTIDLISIGIVCEDGREFYGINWDCDFKHASKWVQENVLIHLPFRPVNEPTPNTQNWYTKKDLKLAVLDFLGCTYGTPGSLCPGKYYLSNHISKPEFWGYYADYDWVVFCQLFGRMIDLPQGFPMYCRDIKQWCDQLGNPKLPEQGKGEHSAIADAKWNKTAWEFLQKWQDGLLNASDWSA